MTRPTATAQIETPVGRLLLTADESHLLAVRFIRDTWSSCSGESSSPLLNETIAQLSSWFAGTLQIFDLPLSPLDTPEACTLRTSIADIPYGETRTYGAVALQTGSVARAVGQACKTNLFPIIIPCHRVVSAAGPEFYSGGEGPRTKSWLIDFEYGNLPLEKRTRLL
jgi:methylated-DNA-[protein]-cysteine S-methyltransferase